MTIHMTPGSTSALTPQAVIEAAYTETVERYGPVPSGTNARHTWFDKHQSDFHDAVRRINASEPAPPIQPDLFAGATT